MKTQVGVSKKINVRQMAVIGMLSAISIMLSMTPLGFIP
ncbi:ECF transporter S component, partial [Turicibacter sanguinis]|nr:ECF transporter S component [Turicibacter sanguinis]